MAPGGHGFSLVLSEGDFKQGYYGFIRVFCPWGVHYKGNLGNAYSREICRPAVCGYTKNLALANFTSCLFFETQLWPTEAAGHGRPMLSILWVPCPVPQASRWSHCDLLGHPPLQVGERCLLYLRCSDHPHSKFITQLVEHVYFSNCLEHYQVVAWLQCLF